MLAQIQVFVEAALSVLLLLGIAYNFHISKTLSALKSDRASLIKLIEKLETSIKNAHDGVEKLRVAGQVSGRPLSRTIEQAKIVGGELDTLVDKADSRAEQLSVLTRQAETSEQALGKLLEDASDIKLDMLRKIETPILRDEEDPVDSAAETLEAQAEQPQTSDTLSRGAHPVATMSSNLDKPKPVQRSARQRLSSKFLGE